MTEQAQAKGLPGGIAAPAVVLAASASLFVFAYLAPGVLTFPFMSPGGVGVMCMAASLFWLLIAIGKRPPSTE